MSQEKKDEKQVEERETKEVPEEATETKESSAPEPTPEEAVAPPSGEPAEESAAEAASRHAGHPLAATGAGTTGSGTARISGGKSGGGGGAVLSAVEGPPKIPDESMLGEERTMPPQNGGVESIAEADLDLDERNVVSVKLGGVMWHAKEPTLDVSKDLALALPEGDILDQTTRDGAREALDSIYPQVREVLFDPSTGRPPSQEFVEKHLTARGFGKLMRKINQDAQEGNPQGA